MPKQTITIAALAALIVSGILELPTRVRSAITETESEGDMDRVEYDRQKYKDHQATREAVNGWSEDQRQEYRRRVAEARQRVLGDRADDTERHERPAARAPRQQTLPSIGDLRTAAHRLGVFSERVELLETHITELLDVVDPDKLVTESNDIEVACSYLVDAIEEQAAAMEIQAQDLEEDTAP